MSASDAPHADGGLECLLHDCFCALGEIVQHRKPIAADAIVWLHRHYHEKFRHAVHVLGNSWQCDRDRVRAVARWLGELALGYAGGDPEIDRAALQRAAIDVEAGCRMNAVREGVR
jgi:hypothetical protein